MYISENSWHYKVTMTFRERTPKSLCSYFWSFVFSMLFPPIAAAFFTAFVLAPLLGIMLDPLITFGTAWVLGVEATHTFMFGNPVGWGAFIFTYVFDSLALLFGYSFWLYNSVKGEELRAKWRSKKELRKAALSGDEPLTAGQMLLKGALAIKNKVCPRIRYVL